MPAKHHVKVPDVGSFIPVGTSIPDATNGLLGLHRRAPPAMYVTQGHLPKEGFLQSTSSAVVIPVSVITR